MFDDDEIGGGIGLIGFLLTIYLFRVVLPLTVKAVWFTLKLVFDLTVTVWRHWQKSRTPALPPP